MADVDSSRQAWRLFLQAHAQVVSTLARELEAEVGLPLTWYDVLAQLNMAPGQRLRSQQLVRALVITKSGLTRRIDRMEEAGLVERFQCAEDRRGLFVALLPAGETALARALPVHLAGVHRHFLDHLSPAQTECMIDVFSKVLAAGDSICEGAET
jgi:DNA-binding MarR family transcriptional regulator